MPSRVHYRQEPDAVQTVKRLAGPQVLDSAEAIAKTIPEKVPVQSGTSRRMFRQGLRAEAAPDGSARVSGLPRNWHWFEFGTRWNPPYAPIRRAVEALGMKWVPR
ncbi:MAG TPA: hypothetical protein VH834_18030 [Solirubrobacteraceae bacterium]|jgi:hypothetical protein